jgi:hypothetical protein
VFSTDPSLATSSSTSQHHSIPPVLPAASSFPQLLSIQAGLSTQAPGLSPPSLSQSPPDPRLSPRTPEQESSFGQNPDGADSDSTKNTSTILNHHEPVHQRLGYQNDTSSFPRYLIPVSPHVEPVQQIQLTSHSTSPLSHSSTQSSPEPGTLVQISPQHIPSRGRRKHDRQFKCSSCSRVFPRRCDLK